MIAMLVLAATSLSLHSRPGQSRSGEIFFYFLLSDLRSGLLWALKLSDLSSGLLWALELSDLPEWIKTKPMTFLQFLKNFRH